MSDPTLTRDHEAANHLPTGSRAYRVTIDGAVIGWVFSTPVTVERRSPGARHVSARWESSRPGWRWRTVDGRELPHKLARETRAAAVHDLISEVSYG